MDELERDAPIELWIIGAEHDSHAANTELLDNDIAADAITASNRGSCVGPVHHLGGRRRAGHQQGRNPGLDDGGNLGPLGLLASSHGGTVTRHSD